MWDKNGREIRTGDIVQITGAYFKNDNAIYFVANSPGDYGWNGGFHSLHKVGKRGKVSAAKYNLCFWPISVCTNNYEKNVLARKWNREHAEIEIIESVPLQEVKGYFETKVTEAQERIEWERRHYGEYESVRLKEDREQKAFYEEIVARVAERMQ